MRAYRQAGQTRPQCSTSLAPSICHQQRVSSTRVEEACNRTWEHASPLVTTSQPQAIGSHMGGQSPTFRTRRGCQVHSASSRASPAPEARTVVQVYGSQLRLIHPLETPGTRSKIMVFLPGTDGTGQAILPHVRSLREGGYDVYCLFMPPQDRSGWPELTQGVTDLLVALLEQLNRQSGRDYQQVTLFGESFGGVLALQVAAAAAGLVEEVILLNPATCFGQSLSGITSVVSSTNLLSFFPPVLYRVAQATLLPLLVDSARLGPEGMERMRSMIDMTPAVDDHNEYSTQATGSSPWRTGPQLPPSLSPSITAAAANFRANLMREGSHLPDHILHSIDVPVLLLSSAKDKMLPSMQEGARLQRVLRKARRVILPESGHAALLEDDLDLLSVLRSSVNLRPGAPLPPPAVGQPTTTAPFPAAPALGNGNMELPGVRSVKQALGIQPPDEAQQDGQQGAANGAGDNGAAAGRYKGEMDGQQVNSWDEWSQILAPWRDLVSPVLLGVENLPPLGSPDASRPMLFVGNHQRIGFYDTPLLAYELAMRGYRVRGLAHPGHWSGPVGPFFEQFGAVKASPMAAYRLLKNNEKVLLFPGGAKEVVKPRGSEYQLFWKDEPDFVRLAAKCGAIIIPFAAVGADDAYNVLMDTDEVLTHPLLGPMARSFYGKFAPTLDVKDAVMPLTGLPGLGLPTPVPIPNLNRLYFKIAPPIDTAALGLNLKDTKAVSQLYTGVKKTVEQNIADLLVYRAGDEDEGVVARLGKALSNWATVLVDTATIVPPRSDATNDSKL